MADINTVTLTGRLTRDCELKYSSGGMAICTFSLAVNRKRKQGEEWVDEVSYFDFVLFGRQGEAISKYLQKGKQVGVAGELRQNRWEQDGNKRSKVEITVNNIQLLGGANANTGSEYTAEPSASRAADGDSQAPPTQQPAAQSSQKQPPDNNASTEFEDDIPF